MYNEGELVVDKFIMNFSSDFGKKIVLYGTGKNTKSILEHVDRDVIHGIMDIQRSGQYVYGRKILTVQEVSELMPDFIVLVCMPSSEQVVYGRIKELVTEKGIKVYNLDKMLLNEVFDGQKSLLDALNGADTEMKKAVASLLLYRLQNDTAVQLKKGKILIKNTEIAGYIFWGPLFMGYMIWMIKTVIKGNCDLILFQARDGYLLEKLYQKIREAYPEIKFPSEVYFLTSRRASVVPGIREEKDIITAAEYPYHGLREKFLIERFGINEVGDENVPLPDCALGNKQEIFTRAEYERKNYIQYVEKLNISDYQKAALIDVTAAGTIQTSLSRFLTIELEGFYFLKRKSAITENNAIPVKSYYESKGAYDIRENVFVYFQLMETILSSQEPSLICFDENGCPIFDEEVRTEKEKDLILRIQNEVIRYSEDFLKLHINWDELYDERDYFDELLGFMNQKYLVFQNDDLSDLVFEDGFSGRMGNAYEV